MEQNQDQKFNYSIDKNSLRTKVTLTGILNRDEGNQIKLLIEQLVNEENPPKKVIFECGQLTKISNMVYPQLLLLISKMRNSGVYYRFDHIDMKLLAQLEKDGIENSLISPLKEDQTELKLDAGILNCFIDASMEVLKVQLDLSVKPGQPFVVENNNKHKPNIHFAGLLQIESETFSCHFLIGFEKPVFLEIYNRMLSTNHKVHEVVDAEIADLAAELANMITGSAKAKLNSLSQGSSTLKRTLPSIIHGDKLHILLGGTKHRIFIPFTSGVGPFEVHIFI